MRWWWGTHHDDAVTRGLAVTRSALLRIIWGVASALSVPDFTASEQGP